MRSSPIWSIARSSASLVLGLSLSLSALGAPLNEQLDALESPVRQLTKRSEVLEAQVQQGRALLRGADTQTRFDDAVYLHLIDKNKAAAEEFFTLVTAGVLTDPGMHRDAEWFLAESLFKMGNLVTAESRYKVVLNDRNHPYRTDAAMRLLELYADQSETDKFNDLYQKEIVRGSLEATPEITYTVGRSFYRQGDLVRAKSYFSEVQAGTVDYLKSRYFLGVIALIQQNADEAIPHFQEVASSSVVTREARQVIDLSLLAIARIHFDKGDFRTATEFYGRVGADSEYQAEMLYELVWTLIKQERFKEAINSCGVFLLAYPEHQYAGELRVLQGHLYMAQARENPLGASLAYSEALARYEEVVAEYSPIRNRFKELSFSSSAGANVMTDVVALQQKGEVPEFALALIMDDPELARALDVYSTLEEQERDLEASESLVAELRAALGVTDGLGAYDELRYEVVVAQSRALQKQVELLALEQQWLRSNLRTGGESHLLKVNNTLGDIQRAAEAQAQRVTEAESGIKDNKSKVDKLRDEATTVAGVADAAEADLREVRTLLRQSALPAGERVEAEDKLTLVLATLQQSRSRLAEIDVALSKLMTPQVDMSAQMDPEVTKAIDALRNEHRDLRADRTAETAKRFDALQTSLAVAQENYAKVLSRVDGLEDSELGRIRSRFQVEVEEVAQQREDLNTTLGDAQAVSAKLTRAGFGRIEDFFAESVLNADMGIVDVYWAQKVDATDELERVLEEKNALLSDLRQRFQYIQQKLNQ